MRPTSFKYVSAQGGSFFGNFDWFSARFFFRILRQSEYRQAVIHETKPTPSQPLAHTDPVPNPNPKTIPNPNPNPKPTPNPDSKPA